MAWSLPTASSRLAAQPNQLVNTLRIGDVVVTPRKATTGVAIGEVSGDYTFDAADPFRQ